MVAQFLTIHPQNPQARLIDKAVLCLRSGGVAAIPTDSSYALACRLDDKAAVDRIRQIRGIDEKHLLTLICPDLKSLSTYAYVDNRVYRILKMATPGAFTFILEATKEVPRRLSHRSRKTIGLRVPQHNILYELLIALGEPLISTSLILSGDTEPLTQADDIIERVGKQVDLVIDGGACFLEPTTVIDLSNTTPEVVRIGRADPKKIGL